MRFAVTFFCLFLAPSFAVNLASLIVIGDSISVGLGATTPSLGYANLLGAMYKSFSNMGVDGTEIADQLDNVISNPIRFAPIPSTNAPTMVTELGTNDVNQYGLNADKMANFSAMYGGLISWLTIPAANKVFTVGGCTMTGTWGGGTYPSSAASSTSGDTVTCSVVSHGGPIYALYGIFDGGTGTGTIAVDGGTPVSITNAGQNGAAILTASSTAGSPVGIRLPVSAGTHSVVWRVTSSTTGTNFAINPIWVGAAPASYGATGPTLYCFGVLRQQFDAVASTTLAYDAMVQAAVTTYAGDGLPVTYVPDRLYVGPSTTDMSDNYHPNNNGHMKMLNSAVVTMFSGSGGSNILGSATLNTGVSVH